MWGKLFCTILAACCAVGLSPLRSYAQEDGLVLPNPDEIFADNVEVLATGVVADHEARMIYYFYEGIWRSLPYPDNATRLYPAPPGTLNLAAYTSHNIILEIDPESATLQPIVTHCGQYGMASTTDYYSRDYSRYAHLYDDYELPLWVPFDDPVSGHTYPCLLTSGILAHPIPEDLTWFHGRFQDWGESAVSPTGEWIVLSGAGSQNGLVAVYGFNTNTGDIIRLGELVPDEITNITTWITNTQFILYSGGMPSWSSRNEYTADVTSADSLEWALSGYPDSPHYFENPPRLELMSDIYGTENSNRPQQGPCVLRLYDFQTNTHSIYDMGSICDYGIMIPNGNGDRLYQVLAPSGSSALVRLNPAIGIRTILYTGELEGIYSISPDGQYAILRLDDSGRTDFYLNPYPTSDVPAIDLSDAVLFDLTTSQMVYHFTDLAPSENPFDSARLVWLNAQQILIVSEDRPARLISIDQNTFSEQTLSGIVRYISDDKSWLILQHTDLSMSKYDIATQTQQPFVNSLDPNKFELAFSEDNDSHLTVIITILKPNSDSYELPLLKLTVSLPDTP